MKLKLDPTLTAAQLERAADRLTEWKDVVAFFTVRLALAPVMESLVLLDRCLFLHEYGETRARFRHGEPRSA